ncbi:hypothetical protein POKO110462_18675 [Pontibacter korlensis]|uniref:Uncharacterized protein n=1 Tax=Pontibacter korlensis TaxID=400092 RepID=A0A0E3UYD0_9BACT|nr:hypothetical protein [Pontibacter korlensis]AKD05012.1 hypothetical protein PKOR_20425 [Pontibacter korlensis]
MDFESIIIGIISLAIFIVPVILIQRKQKGKSLERVKSLTALGEKHHIKIEQHDFCSNYAIGIDSVQHKLLYLKEGEQNNQEVLVDLSRVLNCSVNKAFRDVNHTRIMDKIELVFSFKEPKTPKLALTFYDKEISLTLNDELRLCEKWSVIVNETIQARPNGSAVEARKSTLALG